MGAILVVNAGSTSLKLDLVAEDGTAARVGSLDEVDPAGIDAVAHRVVHGGSRYREPVVLDRATLDAIVALEPLAPLHNAPAVAGIEAARARLPDVPQIGVFDTGFHRTMPPEAAEYALPSRWREEWDVRRFGFHGLSVEWSSERSAELLGRDASDLRLVVCHLGGGSSVTAVRGGRSVDTTMGFSPLEGVPMTTRSGSVDPGALVYLLRERGLDVDTLDHALNADSGLKALTGQDGMRELEAAVEAGDSDAEFGLSLFVHRLAAAVAGMAAASGGLDALVFTAGIGENSALVRRRLCDRLGFLCVSLDPSLNDAAVPDCDVSVPSADVRVLVIRAREELVAAREARRLLARRHSPQVSGQSSPRSQL